MMVEKFFFQEIQQELCFFGIAVVRIKSPLGGTRVGKDYIEGNEREVGKGA